MAAPGWFQDSGLSSSNQKPTFSWGQLTPGWLNPIAMAINATARSLDVIGPSCLPYTFVRRVLGPSYRRMTPSTEEKLLTSRVRTLVPGFEWRTGVRVLP